MGQAVGQALLFGVGVALSPIPIIPVVLMLSSPGGNANAFAFIGGWIAAIAVLGTILLLLASGGDASESGAPADWVSILKVVLGAFLIVLAARQWRARPRGDEVAELPGWIEGIDRFSPVRSVGLAAALSMNPKNLILVLGACAAIAQTGASTADQATALAVFVAISTLGVAAPVAVYYLTGDRAAGILADLREWMARENATIVAVICLLIGVKLIGDAIGALTA